MATAAPAQSLAYLLDPSLYGNQIDIGNQQAIAGALLQSGLSPMGDTQIAGNVAIRNSPVQGLAKIAQLLSGIDMQQNLIPRQIQQMYGQAGANMQAVGGIGGQGGGLVPRLPGDQSGMLSSFLLGSDPSKFAELTAAANQPLDIDKMLIAQGIYPGTQKWADAHAVALNKQNSMPIGRGGVLQPDGSMLAPAPSAQEGYSSHFNPQTGQWEQVPQVNGPQAVQAASTAQAAGKAAVVPTVQQGPDQRPVQSTQLLDAQRGGYGGIGNRIPPAVQAQRDQAALQIAQQELQTTPPGPQRDQLIGAIQRMQAGGSPVASTVGTVPQNMTPMDPAAQAGRQGQQDYVQKSWAATSGTAAQAQPIINNLQQIQSYAQQAQTGQQADRLRLVDSVLSLLGSQSAADRQVAGDLLGKNAAQIVARLGSGGGMDTDAARGLLMSAFPNAHMMSQAILEASTNLIAQQKMAQAKAQVMLPVYGKNDPPSYIQQETQFNQAADPRIFQWMSMPPGQAKQAYLMTILKQDPSLGAKAKQLEAMGVTP